MAFDIVPLKPKHLEDAARLAARRYQALREQVPMLPPCYGEVDTLLPMLKDIQRVSPGVAALHGGDLVGFWAAWLIPSFRGRRASYSPEWANGAELNDSARIYETMYARVSQDWVAVKHRTHLLALLPNDTQALNILPWMGFGMVAADAVRDLSPLPETSPNGVEIRQATRDDLDTFMALEGALAAYLAGSPTYLIDLVPDNPMESQMTLSQHEKVVWLAMHEGRAVGYLITGSASRNASTIIHDEGTCSITGAYTLSEARGNGIATALLNRGLAWAREAGYTRCAVDFEPMNPLARRFWLRYFTPVCYTFGRHIGY